jgi:DHA2 family multidrug resistance protein
MSAVAPTVAARAGIDNKWLVASSIGVGAMMGSIDSSIVNVALPHIRGSVGATIEEITWVSTAYIIAMVIVMPLTAFLGSFFGQKRVYMASLALFVGGSALCGMAHSLTALVLFRTIQGLGAGALQPTQQAILRQTFPLEEQGMAMATLGMVLMFGPAIGPTLGGWLTDNYSWQWIFYINLPIGILGLFMVLEFVHEPEDIRRANHERAEAHKKDLDWQGVMLISVGAASLQYVLEEGQRNDWFQSNEISFFAFLAGATLAAFVVRELTAPAPVVNLRLFKERTFMAGTVIGGVQFAVLMSSMFLMPVFMQEILGFDATQSGLMLMPRAFVMMALMPVIGRLYNRLRPAALIGAGVLFIAAGCFQLSRVTTATSFRDLLLPMITTGIGFAAMFVPLTTVALSRIPRAQLTDAAGMNSFFRQIGGSIGITVFATLLTRFATQARASVGWHVSALRPEAMMQLGAMQHRALGLGFGTASRHAAMMFMNGRVAVQGIVLAFEKSFLLQGVCFLAILPLLWFLWSARSVDGLATGESVE